VFILEFAIFVASSGLFYSERFRHHFWAVVIAGAVALGSSLIFVYDVYVKLMVHTEAPVKIVKQLVRVPVMQRVSQPPALSKPENCRDDYPFIARMLSQEGTTELAFQVLADGTVSGVSVSKSSGSDRLDDAAVECVSKWHYRPAIKDGKLVDTPLKVSVAWNLEEGDGEKK
jgi:TonB family protein